MTALVNDNFYVLINVFYPHLKANSIGSMLSDGLFRGVHIYKGCSRHSSLKEWLSPTSSCDLRSIRREVESFPK